MTDWKSYPNPKYAYAPSIRRDTFELVAAILVACAIIGIALWTALASPPWKASSPQDNVVAVIYYEDNSCPGGCEIGTGTIVDGRILTAAHVVENPLGYPGKVGDLWPTRGQDNRTHYARIVVYDAKSDIAILAPLKDNLGPGAELQCEDGYVGQSLKVYGYPIGFGLTVTEGQIIRLDTRPNPSFYGALWPVSYLFDAAVTDGNSGGPAFASDGRVVGVVVGIILSPYTGGQIGLNILVPAKVACGLFNSLDNAA